jgi:small-conductance mechanosensitive channel/CRP-like cAMP-binding protein
MVSVISAPYLPESWRIFLWLLAVPGIYVSLVLLGRFLKRRHGVRLSWLYHPFALGCALYIPANLLGLEADWPDFIPYVGEGTVILGAVFLIALVDRYVWELYFKQKHNVEVPKFLAEIVRVGILLAIVFLVMEYKHHTTLNSLLFTSGLAAVILGLAMQDSVGNIIAGLTLQFGKPYRHGDWLLLDKTYAQVIEVNWRSTRLKTNDDIVIEIPHRQMAAQTIVNLNRPEMIHAMRISVGIDYNAPPTRVKDILVHATSNARGVASEPRPKVYLKNFGDSSIEYEIKFWLADQSQYFDVCDAIRTNVWYSLQRNGIKIPFPIRTVQLERPQRNKQLEVQTAARAILRQQPLFKCLNDEQLDALLPRGRVVHFGRSEKLIQQGDNGDSMFVLVEGEASVMVERNGFQTHVATLKSGDCFGEMSLLTGERRSATIMANLDCEVVEIGKNVLATSLKDHPNLVQKLSELLALRQMENDGALAASARPTEVESKQTEYETTFVTRLRSFFEL